MGRPVIYAGSSNSAIYGWIQQLHLGYRLDNDFVSVLEQLLQTPEGLNQQRQNAIAAYRMHFSRTMALQNFEGLLSYTEGFSKEGLEKCADGEMHPHHVD